MLDRIDLDDIPPTARLFWVGHHFRIRATYADRYDLECTDGFQLHRTLPRNQVRVLKHCGDLEVEAHYFDLDGKPASTGTRARLLADAPVEDQRVAMKRLTVGKMAIRDYRAGRLKRYETQKPPKSGRRRRFSKAVTLDVWLHENEDRIHEACWPYYVLHPGAPKTYQKPRLGQPGPPSLGSAASLKKIMQKMDSPGFRITDLLPDKDGLRRGGRKMAPDMEAFVETEIRSFLLVAERPSVALFRGHLKAQLNSLPELKNRSVPSHGAIENVIRGLKDGLVIAARFGLAYMEQQSIIRTKGPEYTRVGEKIIMDCWKIDQVTLVKNGEGWMLVNEELEEEWGVRRRLWVAMAIDACSRVVLGMALGYSESSDLTRQALRMVVSDKSMWADDAGCEAPPPPPIRPESILTDVGSAFKNPHFAMSALELTRDTDIGTADSAHLRGVKERHFRSLKERVLAFFTGTTFGDVITLGDYDAMGRASSTVGTLGRSLFLHINDVYHLSPHGGLKGQPPIDRFNEQVADYGACESASSEDQRVIFGLDMELPVTRQGCWFAGNHYWSGRLGAHFRDERSTMRNHNGTPMIRAKIDPLDLGRISVWIMGTWATLIGPPEMHRVGMTDWLDTCREIKIKHGAQAAVHYDIVASALRKLAQRGTEARLQANVLDMSYDSEALASAANRIRIHFVERAKPTKQGALLAFDSTSNEASFETSGVEDFFEVLPILPEDDDTPKVREETDRGLDDVNIDRDGDLIDQDNDTNRGDANDLAGARAPPKVAPPAAPREPPKLLVPLPTPTRKI